MKLCGAADRNRPVILISGVGLLLLTMTTGWAHD